MRRRVPQKDPRFIPCLERSRKFRLVVPLFYCVKSIRGVWAGGEPTYRERLAEDKLGPFPPELRVLQNSRIRD